MKYSSNEKLNFILRENLNLLHSGSCQNCMTSVNLVAEILQKLSNERAMSIEEPCTCEYGALLQSSHRGTLSIHLYIAHSFQHIFSMYVLFRRCFKTAIFSRSLKVAIAMSNYMNKVYNDESTPDFSVSMLKETISLLRDYIHETRK